MNPEIHTFVLNGAPLRAHLSHTDALAVLAASGFNPPEIPPGCNTVRAHVELKSGEHALVSVQRGFAPTARDDEREVNGALLLVLTDPNWNSTDARAILDRALETILTS